MIPVLLLPGGLVFKSLLSYQKL
uniref:Uncharacterized protein n=1 Tax=Rhizophora mucronata TaxID=61149 RepID=A0A2P2QGC4_RHIMU